MVIPIKFFAPTTGQFSKFVISKYKRIDIKLFLSFAFIILLSSVLMPSVHAQAVTWTQTDIGGTGATGTYSYSSGTYTIGGAGTGIGGTADSFSYVSTPTTGNIEMSAKVTSQTNTNNYAVSGLMMRDSLNANGAGAVIGVSPTNGVNFTYRTTDGAASTTILGPSVSAPVWLRLVHSGSSFAGYESSDGINWVLVGNVQITMPSSYYVGFAVSSNSYGNLSTAVFNSVAYMTSVPQRSANLITWLRADAGVTYNSGQVSLWADQSGNGNNAGQATSADQPTLSTGAINGLPALSFNGSSQFLQFGSGFANFSSGASIFVVTNPATLGSYQTWVSFGNSGSNYLGLEQTSTSGSVSFYTYSGSSSSAVTAASALSASQYQLVESVYNGTNTATIYNNGVQKGTGSSLLTAPTTPPRTINYVGQFAGSGAYLNGQIAEILVYNTALSSVQRAAVESYIYSKYGIGNQPTLNTPTISPGLGVFSSNQTITITADPGASIYYTTNGTTPTTSSTLYTGPFVISSSTTVKAIAAATDYTTSAVASAYIQIDPSTANLPLTNLQVWLKADNGVVLGSGSSVSQWTDMSGNANNATQSNSSFQPTLVTNAINSLPALSFNGTNEYLQLGSGFANFTAGASIFVVTYPAALGSYQTWLHFGGSSSNNYLGFEATNTSGSVATYVYNGTTGSVLTATSAITASQYQLMETVYNGSNTATIYNNGVQKAQSTSMQTAPNTTRTNNYVGQFGGSTHYVNGQIAEILVYNTALTSVQKAAVEAYIYGRYGIGNQPTLNTPTISPGLGVFSTNQTITITADPGASIYYTTNGTTPTTSSTLYTGPFVISSSTTVKAIAAATDYTTSAVASAYIQIDPNTANLPQTNLITWLKADNGVVTSGSSVTQWTDMSPTANNATQSNSSDQPTLVTNAVNGLPAISFNGTSDFLQFGSGFANFTAGASIFVVVNPISFSGYQTWFNVGTSGANYLGLEEITTAGSVGAFVYNSTTSSGVSAASAITTGSFQLLDTVYNGSNTSTIYNNGTQLAQSTSMQTAPNSTRTLNYVGQLASSTALFHGQIAEILVYNTALTASQRAAVENYLHARYGISVNAPSFTLPTGVYATGQTITITADPGASIYYTTDGSTPTTSSTPYTAPVTINTSTTVKAIAVQSFATSSVSSVFIQIDPTTAGLPTTNLQLWLKSDIGVTTSGSNVTQWNDMSGNGNNGTQGTPADQPSFIANAINGLPALAFSTTMSLNLPSGWSNFTSQGFDEFIVLEPTGSSMDNTFMYIGNSSSTNCFTLEQNPVPNGISLAVANGSTLSRVSTSSGVSPLSQWQTIEGALSAGTSPTGSVYINNVLAASGTSQYLNTVTRTSNFVGAFSGNIAEILLYNAPLSATQRAQVEGYLLHRYQLSGQTPTAPIISVAGGSLSGPTQVALAAQSGTSIYYTTDGTTPTTSSNLYSGAINVYYGETLKAIAVANGVSSTVASATYTLNSTQWPAPASGGPPLQFNLQLPTTAVPQ